MGMSRAGDEQMWGWTDVEMDGAGDERSLEWTDVGTSRGGDGQKWGWLEMGPSSDSWHDKSIKVHFNVLISYKNFISSPFSGLL